MNTLRPLLLAGGIVLLLVGLLWIGQGTGVFPYPARSFMINQSPWIWRGAALALVGAICMVWSRRAPVRPAPR